ncbi:MAG TPA: hypothetical protein PKD85_07155, partial [Saprospiraceae bacterium]|nr:hypothetical protein [Saprospiraceae bacterium]
MLINTLHRCNEIFTALILFIFLLLGCNSNNDGIEFNIKSNQTIQLDTLVFINDSTVSLYPLLLETLPTLTLSNLETKNLENTKKNLSAPINIYSLKDTSAQIIRPKV